MPLPLVVHIITKLELGGAQQNTLDSCRLLDRRRYRAALLTGHGGMLDPEAARIDDLDLRFVRDLVRPISPQQDVRAYRDLRDHLLDLAGAGGEVIVHTHCSKAGVVGRLAARGAGLRNVVHTYHGFGHYAFKNPLKRRVAIALEQRIARDTSRFIAVSRANVAEGKRLGLFADAPVELIHSGFDVASFRDPGVDRREARRRLGLPPDVPLVGTVACLKSQKRPLDFVRAAARVRRNRPDVEFAIAGDGELRGEVESLRSNLGLDRALHLLGWQERVEQVLPAFDVFWLTSGWEGLPRAVVQAMAAGVPVVASAADGVVDVVEDGVTGVLLPIGAADAIADRTLELLDDPERRARLAEAARRVCDEFEVTEMARRLEQLYDELLRRRPDGSDVDGSNVDGSDVDGSNVGRDESAAPS